jgi:hypothetical protein
MSKKSERSKRLFDRSKRLEESFNTSDESIHLGLFRLRTPTIEHWSRIYKICEDQTNLERKGYQSQLIGSILERAVHFLILFGIREPDIVYLVQTETKPESELRHLMKQPLIRVKVRFEVGYAL